MQLTNLIIRNTMKKINFSDKNINELLEKRRQQLIDIGRKKRQELDDQYHLENWNEN